MENRVRRRLRRDFGKAPALPPPRRNERVAYFILQGAEQAPRTFEH
jgi:hypothetical protein